MLLDQVRNDFGVGFGYELVPFRRQLFSQRQVVFDDAVVDHYDLALAVPVRMRVLLGWPPMRRPTRVPDAVRTSQRFVADDFFKVAQFAGSAPHIQTPLLGKNRYPRRV